MRVHAEIVTATLVLPRINNQSSRRWSGLRMRRLQVSNGTYGSCIVVTTRYPACLNRMTVSGMAKFIPRSSHRNATHCTLIREGCNVFNNAHNCDMPQASQREMTGSTWKL